MALRVDYSEEMPYKDPGKHREYLREHYKRNSAKRIREVAERRVMLKLYLDEKKDGPCVDCGETYPPYVMDFDHVRGEKVFALSDMARRGTSKAKLDAEIEKCDLVCANCHRERTHGPVVQRQDTRFSSS